MGSHGGINPAEAGRRRKRNRREVVLAVARYQELIRVSGIQCGGASQNGVTPRHSNFARVHVAVLMAHRSDLPPNPLRKVLCDVRDPQTIPMPIP